MIRRTSAWIVIGTFLAMATQAAALVEPTSVTPNPVRRGKKITVTASDCVSGGNWEAVVVISILNEAGDLVYSAHIPADESGTTEQTIKIKKGKYPKGNYTVYVDCVHEFEDGSSETHYTTDHELTVKKAKKK